jgi:hypothetical protein
VKGLFSFELHQIIITAALIIVGLIFITVFLPKPLGMLESFVTFSNKANLAKKNTYTEIFDFSVEPGFKIMQVFIDTNCLSKIRAMSEFEFEGGTLLDSKLYYMYAKNFPPVTDEGGYVGYALCIYKETVSSGSSGIEYLDCEDCYKESEMQIKLAEACVDLFEDSNQITNGTLVCLSLYNGEHYPLLSKDFYGFRSITGPYQIRYLEFIYTSGHSGVRMLPIAQSS